jgi:hypothetical protein
MKNRLSWRWHAQIFPTGEPFSHFGAIAENSRDRPQFGGGENFQIAVV